ncbi:MAG TPA: biotin--[acetyl-CoA-carboxylase] ligase [Nocardioides sp.]|uniref:biotin--[acetyl-CoA-carboxylase] ligase n=1 Tax=Nocardioides sp. TaxID=35761 RepID=UPI002F417A17
MNDATPRAPLVLERLQEAAGPRWQVHLHAEAESTNALAATTPEPGLVVVADHQTAGRGRLGRTWVTPEGAALTFSAVVDPGLDDEWWPLLPLVAGYAVARTVGGSLKWPNDVLLGGRKVCGILVERVHVRGRGADTPLAVVGIGLNVDQTSDELPVPTATSLALETGPRDRTELFGELLDQLRTGLDAAVRSPGDTLRDYRGLCDTLAQEVRVELPGGETLEGRAVDVDEHGRLVVENAEGTVVVAAGDVVHVRPSE